MITGAGESLLLAAAAAAAAAAVPKTTPLLLLLLWCPVGLSLEGLAKNRLQLR